LEIVRTIEKRCLRCGVTYPLNLYTLGVEGSYYPENLSIFGSHARHVPMGCQCSYKNCGNATFVREVSHPIISIPPLLPSYTVASLGCVVEGGQSFRDTGGGCQISFIVTTTGNLVRRRVGCESSSEYGTITSVVFSSHPTSALDVTTARKQKRKQQQKRQHHPYKAEPVE